MDQRQNPNGQGYPGKLVRLLGWKYSKKGEAKGIIFSKAYLFLKLKYAIEIQPRIKANPPKGVMAPNQVIPDTDRT